MQKDAVKKANTATIKKANNKKMFNQGERKMSRKSKKAFNIPSFLDSLKKSIEGKRMTYEEAANELYRGGYFSYVPSKTQVKKKLG